MSRKTGHLRLLAFWLVLAVVSAFGLAGAAWAPLREFATISLFIPLIWGFMTLRPGGMIAVGVILSVVRLAEETLHIRELTGQWDLPSGLAEALFPILLYLALGLVFHVYRRRQAILVSRLVEVGTVEARERLASSLAHDFNNVLTVIVGTCSLLLKRNNLDESTRGDVQIMSEAGKQGAAIVAQMRMAIKSQFDEMASVDLSDLVDGQMHLIERMLGPHIHVVRHSSGPLPVRVNRGQILRLLMNLCVNARDAMPQGGVLSVHTGGHHESGLDWAQVTISDSGKGIDPQAISRVFEPFFSARPDSPGMGLGLAIVKAIAAAHGGTVTAKNVPGSGASFTVLLPLDVPVTAK